MKTSMQLKELATALSKAQGQMTGAEAKKKGGFGKYADLKAVIKALSKPFLDNGLCFVQGAEFSEGYLSVKTRIMHNSGQWIESETILPPTKNNVHGYASAITYGKRYGLQALVGLPSIDDDGTEAVNQGKNEAAEKRTYYSKFTKDKSRMIERFNEGFKPEDIITSIEGRGLIVSAQVKEEIKRLHEVEMEGLAQVNEEINLIHEAEMVKKIGINTRLIKREDDQ
jgi:hypothetical protein